MILKPDLFPIQDDPENRRCRVGVLRGNANTNAERRGSETRPDQRVLESQRRDRFRGAEACGDLRLDTAGAGRPGVWSPEQEATGQHPGLPKSVVS